jgi:hypothetical protein
MAIRKGALSGAGFRAGDHHAPIEGSSAAIVDFVAASTNPSQARLGVLAEEFTDLAMFDEWTTAATHQEISARRDLRNHDASIVRRLKGMT